MARLPIPGSDTGAWGSVLNDFLEVEHNLDGTLKAGGTIASKADDSSVVHNTGSESVAGTKTFSEPVVVATPTAASHATTKAYVDSSVSAGAPDATTTSKGIVQLTGDLAGTATSPTVPGLAGKEPAITAGTTSQYYRGDKSFQTLDKAAVGLANVDNTSDANKPVSTSTQTALDGKVSTSRQIISGTGLSGGGDLTADRTLIVNYGVAAGTAAQGNDSRITGAIQASTATTKGDLIAATGASAVTRLGVGTDNQVLIADSTQTSGLRWSTASTTDANAVHKGDLVFNVKDYGAVGNGTTDDTAAIQSALDAASAAGGGIVFFPPATTYKVVPVSLSRALLAKAKVTMMGYGATIKVGDSSPAYRSIIENTSDVSGFRMIGLTIDQNGPNNVPANVSGGGPANEYRFVLSVTLADGITITDCTFINIDSINTLVLSGSVAGGVYGVKNISVSNCLFKDIGGTIVHDHSTIYTNCEGARIENNSFMGRLTGGAPSVAAICAIETHGPHQVVVGNDIQNFISGINLTAASWRADACICTGNAMSNVMSGIRANVQDTSSSTEAQLMRGATITDNSILINPDFWAPVVPHVAYGIYVVHASDAAVKGMVIANNVIEYNTYTGTDTTIATLSSAGIVYNRSAVGTTNPDINWVISGNSVRGSIGPGIAFLAGKITGVQIVGNQVTDSGHVTLAGVSGSYTSGILISTTIMQQTVISNNNVVDSRVTGVMRYGIYWGANTASVNNNIFDNSVLLTYASSPTTLFINTTSGAPYIRHRVSGGTTATPTNATAYGSQWIVVSTGSVYTQTTSGSGTTWQLPNIESSYLFTAGKYYSARGTRAAIITTQDRLYFLPFWVGRPGTVDRIGAEVTIAGAAGVVLRFGIYADNGNGLPGALVVDGGTVAADTLGGKEVTISQAISAGLNWLACVSQNAGTQPTVRMVSGSGGAEIPVGTGTLTNATASTGYLCYGQNSISGALPANATPASISEFQAGPLIAVRAA